jgi:hypothetical protein
MAASATVTRTGDGLQFGDTGQAMITDRQDDPFFRHFQTAADQPIRASSHGRASIARSGTIGWNRLNQFERFRGHGRDPLKSRMSGRDAEIASQHHYLIGSIRTHASPFPEKARNAQTSHSRGLICRVRSRTVTAPLQRLFLR